MKSLFKNLQTLLIIVLAIIIILLRNCKGKVEIPEPEIKIVETTVIDTLEVEVPTYIPKWTERKLPPDTVYINVDTAADTAAVLMKYFTEYTYKDTIDHDTVKIFINDKVTKNRIVSRDLSYKILYPTTTITKTITEKINEREFYIGPKVYSTMNQLQYVGIESVFRTKKRTALSVGVGVNEDFHVQGGIGFYWKLNK
jgi:hypothetical protein